MTEIRFAISAKWHNMIARYQSTSWI
ncbi:hypothetical protein SBRY_110183 [Actinacidiphila bryophytorum]|uniref:Uncharacterized protein n=1 Tax=Actinacidiphila bryophytorum TaxID=1436133 RepID=A0A9W4GX95_9ACTN|nr:hypothetical protein SBRY_110183 [Actinacidiphila bryophytorum]